MLTTVLRAPLPQFLPQLEKVMEAFVSGTQAAVANAKNSGLEGEALAKKTMEECVPHAGTVAGACVPQLAQR